MVGGSLIVFEVYLVRRPDARTRDSVANFKEIATLSRLECLTQTRHLALGQMTNSESPFAQNLLLVCLFEFHAKEDSRRAWIWVVEGKACLFRGTIQEVGYLVLPT